MLLVTLADVGNFRGKTDAWRQRLTRVLLKRRFAHDRHYIYVRPKYVLEVEYQEATRLNKPPEVFRMKSTGRFKRVHGTLSIGAMSSLRFPRGIRLRFDKSVNPIDVGLNQLERVRTNPSGGFRDLSFLSSSFEEPNPTNQRLAQMVVSIFGEKRPVILRAREMVRQLMSFINNIPGLSARVTPTVHGFRVVSDGKTNGCL